MKQMYDIWCTDHLVGWFQNIFSTLDPFAYSSNIKEDGSLSQNVQSQENVYCYHGNVLFDTLLDSKILVCGRRWDISIIKNC